ncbi:UNVERIFIED_ORG: outer membrane protein assembly factor BamA [Arthrobacter globiformis]|nr:outer membrane protein assembly factor BamA [Arthrobacter globiformis]
MSNEILPAGNTPRGLNFWQNRELGKIEQNALLAAGTEVARHQVDSVKKELANAGRLQEIRHAEERGRAAINATDRVVDLAIAAVGDSEIKSHHLSKILNRTTSNLAELV